MELKPVFMETVHNMAIRIHTHKHKGKIIPVHAMNHIEVAEV
jgi:hypothetical protein